jgi:hypothetical protein
VNVNGAVEEALERGMAEGMTPTRRTVRLVGVRLTFMTSNGV